MLHGIYTAVAASASAVILKLLLFWRHRRQHFSHCQGWQLMHATWKQLKRDVYSHREREEGQIDEDSIFFWCVHMTTDHLRRNAVQGKEHCIHRSQGCGFFIDIIKSFVTENKQPNLTRLCFCLAARCKVPQQSWMTQKEWKLGT